MTAPRRRILRSPVSTPHNNPRRPQQLLKVRTELSHERAALARWQQRFRRAFNAMEKAQRKISRLERRITEAEE